MFVPRQTFGILLIGARLLAPAIAYSQGIASITDAQIFGHAISVASSAPPTLRQELLDVVEQCRRSNGLIAPIATLIDSLDLNGDGFPDFLVDLSSACLGANQLYCDANGQCRIQVWLSAKDSQNNPILSKVMDRYALSALVDHHQGQRILRMEFSSNSCGASKSTNTFCSLNLLFKGLNVTTIR